MDDGIGMLAAGNGKLGSVFSDVANWATDGKSGTTRGIMQSMLGIDKRAIELSSSIKSVGRYDATVRLRSDVIAALTIEAVTLSSAWRVTNFCARAALPGAIAAQMSLLCDNSFIE